MTTLSSVRATYWTTLAARSERESRGVEATRSTPPAMDALVVEIQRLSPVAAHARELGREQEVAVPHVVGRMARPEGDLLAEGTGLLEIPHPGLRIRAAGRLDEGDAAVEVERRVPLPAGDPDDGGVRLHRQCGRPRVVALKHAQEEAVEDGEEERGLVVDLHRAVDELFDLDPLAGQLRRPRIRAHEVLADLADAGHHPGDEIPPFELPDGQQRLRFGLDLGEGAAEQEGRRVRVGHAVEGPDVLSCLQAGMDAGEQDLSPLLVARLPVHDESAPHAGEDRVVPLVRIAPEDLARGFAEGVAERDPAADAQDLAEDDVGEDRALRDAVLHGVSQDLHHAEAEVVAREEVAGRDHLLQHAVQDGDLGVGEPRQIAERLHRSAVEEPERRLDVAGDRLVRREGREIDPEGAQGHEPLLEGGVQIGLEDVDPHLEPVGPRLVEPAPRVDHGPFQRGEGVVRAAGEPLHEAHLRGEREAELVLRRPWIAGEPGDALGQVLERGVERRALLGPLGRGEVHPREIDAGRRVLDQVAGEVQVVHDVEERARVGPELPPQEHPDAVVEPRPLLDGDHRVGGLLDLVVDEAMARAVARDELFPERRLDAPVKLVDGALADGRERAQIEAVAEGRSEPERVLRGGGQAADVAPHEVEDVIRVLEGAYRREVPRPAAGLIEGQRAAVVDRFEEALDEERVSACLLQHQGRELRAVRAPEAVADERLDVREIERGEHDGLDLDAALPELLDGADEGVRGAHLVVAVGAAEEEGPEPVGLEQRVDACVPRRRT
ncbi:hypothetical protein WMF04_04925 [Sorangium sp. So ce260]|uniref:hypothetical protein n=1 Tax=Sorangium sp. So ce260 TaxID=3133291 RepID=UPI003F61E19C